MKVMDDDFSLNQNNYTTCSKEIVMQLKHDPRANMQ